MLQKEKSHAFRKDVYLLGIDRDGIKYWLESPSWDCEWYWGFGYIETYRNNTTPSRARDIDSHQHFEGLFLTMGKSEFIHHINSKESPLVDTVLTDDEAWELSDLMKRFYTFKESAAMFGRGTAHYTSNTRHYSTNREFAEYINKEELPKIFSAILDILTPK